MGFITGTFLRGLLTLLPFVLSIYVLWWFVSKVELLTQSIFHRLFPNLTLPFGWGIAIAVVLIFAFGLLMSTYLATKFHDIIDNVFKKLPVIKTVYSALSDFIGYFAPSKKKRQGRVVSVKFPNQDFAVVGLMTSDDLSHLPDEVSNVNRIAVYFPMSYQIGGYTLFLPKEWVTELDMTVEEAMRGSITAWMNTSED